MCKNHREAANSDSQLLATLTCNSYDSGNLQKPILVILAVYSTSKVILRRLIVIHEKPHKFLISRESLEDKGSHCRFSQLSTYSCCQSNDFFCPIFKSSKLVP